MSKTKPFARTRLTVSKAQEQIRALLIDNDARGVQFAESFDAGTITLKFARISESGATRTITFTFNVPKAQKARTDKTAARKQEEQRRAATYAALYDVLKAQFAFLTYGGVTFEKMFLAHFEWMIGGKSTTVGDVVQAYLDNPQLMLTAPAQEAAATAAESAGTVDGEYREV